MNAQEQNPYIGPRTFRKEESHLFFGRDREARDLAALVASEKIVLFYAQSGAGKSSLINTRLIPDLERKLFEVPFEVLPVARVSGDAPESIEVQNIYVYNLIRSLIRRETDPALLAGLTIPQFFAKLNEDEKGYFYDQSLTAPIRSSLEITPWPRVLIIDQFEEVFSTHAEAWQKRADFFTQLAQALQDDPYLRLLLVMREDFIAALDPYAYLLPGGLRVRYYMQRLSCEAAIQAVRLPVENLRPYESGVAEKLVDDLSSIKVQKPDGSLVFEPGQYIEPVQLQVVCNSLWQKLTPGKVSISMQDLDSVGDVDNSLGDYYAERVKAVALLHHVNERFIRKWFKEKLISPSGIRTMVLMDPSGQSEGLRNEVIQALPDLIRTEQRGGAVFYELTHDRLVKPILANNEIWEGQNLNALQRGAIVWNSRDRSENLLLKGPDLKNAESYARTAEITDLERSFLDASLKLKGQKRRNLLMAALTVSAIMAMCAVFVIGVGIAAIFVADNQLARQRSEGLRLALMINKENANTELATLLSIRALNGTYAPELDSALVENLDRLYTIHTFAGHTGGIRSIAVSNDGKFLASGGEDYTIRIWETQTGNLVRTLEGHQDWVNDLAFSPDGKYLVSGSFDGTGKIWDVASGEIHAPLSGNPGTIFAVAFSPDGKYVVTGSNDNTAKLWDAQTGQEVRTFTGHGGVVRDVTFSADGDHLLTGSDDKTAKIWDVKTGTLVDTFEGSQEDIYSVAFSPDGKQIVTGGRSMNVDLWDLEAHEKQLNLKGHRNTINSVAFSHDGHYILTGSYDGKAILWSALTGEILRTFSGHSDSVTSVAFSADDQTVFTGSEDSTAKMWLATGSRVPREMIGKDEIQKAIFFPDGHSFLTGGDKGYSIRWSTDTGKGLHVYKGLNAYSTAAAISPDGKYILGVNSSGTAGLWDAETGEEIQDYDQVAWSLAMSPDSEYVLIGGSDGVASLWETLSGKKVRDFSGHEGGVLTVAFSPDGKQVLTNGADYKTIVWDEETGEEKFALDHPDSWVWDAVFSPDGKYILTGDFDHTARLWDAITGQEIRTYKGHTDRLFGVAFSPDGKYFLTGSADNTVKLWDTETGEEKRSLNAHAGMVNSVAFSPDGHYLLTASSDGTARLWDFDYHTTIDVACSILTRDLTDQEREQLDISDDSATCPSLPAQIIPVTSSSKLTPTEIESLAYTGHTLETLILLERLRKSDSAQINQFDAEFWNILCWDGSLGGYFAEVKEECNKAVSLDRNNGMFRDSRGLNRALQGDFSGAIQDFESAVTWLRENNWDEEIIKKREAWISLLQEGVNPFNAQVLETLKNE